VLEVELDDLKQRDADLVEPFEAEQHLVAATVQRVGRGADVFGQEAFGVGLLAEEPSTSFAVGTATDVGDEADGRAVAMD